MDDLSVINKLAKFNRENLLPERILHAKGTGAKGSFRVTRDMRRYTKAKVFQSGRSTDVFVRFSTTGPSKGSSDTVRDGRGFAVKFKTDEGCYDLMTINSSVFFLNDAFFLPDMVDATREERKT